MIRLSARPIITWCDVNMFTTGNQWTIRSGDSNTLYFQLTDLNQDSLRYFTGIGTANMPTSLLVTFPSIDSTEVTQISAQVDPNDPSIWSINVAPNQVLYGGSVKFALTQGANIRTFIVSNMLGVENTSSCGNDAPIADIGTFSYQPGGPGFSDDGV